MRRILSFQILIITLLVSFFSPGCSPGNDDQVDDGDVAVSFNINEPKIRDLLGTDDGYGFAIFYGADIDGSLETCG